MGNVNEDVREAHVSGTIAATTLKTEAGVCFTV